MLKTKIPAIGIDLGGTKIMAAAVSSDGILDDPIKIPTPQGPENIINEFFQLIEHFRKKHTVAGVGIATAGIVDGTGTIIGATGNIPGWTGTRVKQIIESKTMLPTFVLNDANAAAYADAHLHQLRSQKCIVALTIGTGVGGAILIDGNLFHGANWGAGHCGHVKLSMDRKRMCTCGLFDCYEAYASGVGLAITAREIISKVRKDQTPLAQDIEKLQNSDIFLAATQKKDLVAQQIIALWHEHLVTGMVSIAHVLNPNAFILSGGLAKFIDIELINERLVDGLLPPVGQNLKVYRSELGDNAGFMGAAQLALDKLGA